MICVDTKCYADDGSNQGGDDRPLLMGAVLSLKLSGKLPNKPVRVSVTLGSLTSSADVHPIASHLRGKGCGSERSITLRIDPNTKSLVSPG